MCRRRRFIIYIELNKSNFVNFKFISSKSSHWELTKRKNSLFNQCIFHFVSAMHDRNTHSAISRKQFKLLPQSFTGRLRAKWPIAFNRHFIIHTQNRPRPRWKFRLNYNSRTHPITILYMKHRSTTEHTQRERNQNEFPPSGRKPEPKKMVGVLCACERTNIQAGEPPIISVLQSFDWFSVWHWFMAICPTGAPISVPSNVKR